MCWTRLTLWIKPHWPSCSKYVKEPQFWCVWPSSPTPVRAGPSRSLTASSRTPGPSTLTCLGWSPPVIAQLVCQILGVVRIPSEVELLLVERSHGVPYYCEELLKSLYLGNLIVMEEVEDEAKDVDILFPEPTLVVHCSEPSQVGQEEDARAGALGRMMDQLAENV
uniref:Uncharacterized protein n=1 Tax=Hucho hucho TaxID=62062 RepID=A0A4W5QZD4_9TELE